LLYDVLSTRFNLLLLLAKLMHFAPLGLALPPVSWILPSNLPYWSLLFWPVSPSSNVKTNRAALPIPKFSQPKSFLNMEKTENPTFQPAATIEEVLRRLELIIEESTANNNKNVYFAWLYRSVTQAVERRVNLGLFEDNARMEHFDIIFANRYLQAYEEFSLYQKCGLSWQLAFETSCKRWPTIMQHLLLGMNAHIHFDLGIAAAEVSPGEAIHGLKADFWMINQILHEKVDEVQDQLARCWPLMSWIDRLGGRKDEAFARFGINTSRGKAWKIATQLAMAPEAEKARLIAQFDRNACRFGRLIASPNILGMLFFGLIRLTEKGEVEQHMQLLSGGELKTA